MQGHILKRSDTDYIIDCDIQGNGGYNVVPKTVDPCNAYTIEDVEAYIIEHPEMLLDSEAIDTAQLISQAKRQRDSLLKGVVDSMNPMRWETLTEVQKQSWRDYRQALLDIPQQVGYPADIIWPIAP